jgi:hypothetical protein
MAEIRYIASWHEREDVVIVLSDGREIPAVQVKGTGAIYFRDGLGKQRRLDVITRGGREWAVLDMDVSKRYASIEEAILFIESLGGVPIPRGRVAVVGQVGGQLVYASVPAAGAGE